VELIYSKLFSDTILTAYAVQHGMKREDCYGRQIIINRRG